MDAADLAFSGLVRQAELVRSGEVSSRELVDTCLERIARLDSELNAFRVVFGERARAEADQAQARRKGGDERPLLGVPVAIKDDTDVAGETSQVGTGIKRAPAAADAEIVRRLRGAGAIVVGKTNVPELTSMPVTSSVAYGVTRNPWDRERTPGGSSGGSAAAVAAGLVAGATGSDGAGSIRVPAACTNLFGIKPQRDRVPTLPHREMWHGMSVLGPLARSVADAAVLLDVAADAGQEFQAAAARAPERLRVAVATNMPRDVVAKLHPDCRRAVDETAELLRSLGHDVASADLDYGAITLTQAMPRVLRGIHDDPAGLDDPAHLSRRVRRVRRLGGLVSPGVLAKVRAWEGAATARLNRIFERHDVVLTPAISEPPVEVDRWEGLGVVRTIVAPGNVIAFIPFTPVWNVSGQPAVSVPAGFTAGGLPVGVQFVGRPHDEATLISLSAQLEAARPWAARPPIS